MTDVVHEEELTLDQLLEEASPKQEEVPLLLAGELVAEYEAVKARIEGRRRERALALLRESKDAAARVEAGDDRLSSKLPEDLPAGQEPSVQEMLEKVKEQRDPEQDLLDQLGEKIRRRWITVTLHAIDPQVYNELALKHPPRRLDDGQGDPRDVSGVNTDTFYDPLIRLCIAGIKPSHGGKPATAPTAAQVATLLRKVNPGQFDQLANAAARINRLGYTNVPF